MDVPIIFEDHELLVIDKPAGIIVNRSTNATGTTIQDWAEKKYKISIRRLPDKYQKEEEDFYNRAGIVHRLDKETSGILLIAKNPQAFTQLQLQFANRTVIKKYTALVHGKVIPKTGMIKTPVGRLPWNRRKFGVLSEGRIAQTSYAVLSFHEYKHNNYTLLEVTPHTGRTHQIRIHLKYILHPVVGDYLYAGRKNDKEDKQFCPRLFLHAGYIRFQHPTSEKNLEFNCELPPILHTVLLKLPIINY